MPTLPLYNAILAYPPYLDWGEQRTLNIPVWRCVADDCLLVLVTDLANLNLAYHTIKHWGFAYHSANVRKEQLTLCATVGKPDVPVTVGMATNKIKALQGVGLPKLLLNPLVGGGNRTHFGWDVWSPFGWNQVDLFAYPIRSAYVAVDETVLDAAQEVRRIYTEGQEWRFKLGDIINRLIDSRGLGRMDAYAWVNECVGGQISIPQLSALARLAQEVPPSKRDPAIPWSTYYNLYIRTKG